MRKKYAKERKKVWGNRIKFSMYRKRQKLLRGINSKLQVRVSNRNTQKDREGAKDGERVLNKERKNGKNWRMFAKEREKVWKKRRKCAKEREKVWKKPEKV